MKTLAMSFIIFVFLSSASYAQMLYDGNANGGNETPDMQGWQYMADPVYGTLASQTASGGRTYFYTIADENIQSGYFSYNPLSGVSHPMLNNVILDRANGFSVEFGLQLNLEAHSAPDRAGFSVILLSHDLYGIELGFWQDEIWAEAGLPNMFTHAESTGLFNTAVDTDYKLNILNMTYTLYADNNPILTGMLRDYSSWVSPIPGIGSFPYDTPNFMFFGDDTSSALSDVELSYISLQNGTASVPEPSAVILFLLGAVKLIFIRKHK
ncbi:PEP-CTERM sorting domain-containing protein [bacterium]|nr:PEP-CTERM sorting domain-containing protein [bacterium]